MDRALSGMSGRFFWHDPRVDRGYYEEIAGLLHGLLIRLDDRLPRNVVTEIADYIDHNELGLALEWMADALREHGQPLSADERADMLALMHRMKMDDAVAQALASCPAR
jgi:hypothetical protein